MPRKIPLLDRSLCLQFCSYYKPGKNEELACRGYEVIERLLQKSVKILFEKTGTEINHATSELLVQKMCMACVFQKHDCDFMQNSTAPPCGGFVLLSQLLAAKVITIEDVT
jgi:hypothetical protein